MQRKLNNKDATVLALCGMLDEGKETNIYKVELNDGAVQRHRTPNTIKTIRGTDLDLMQFLDDNYVDCTIDDETDELKTLNDWLLEYEECYDPSGSTVVLKINKNGEDIYINSDYNEYYMDELEETKKQETRYYYGEVDRIITDLNQITSDIRTTIDTSDRCLNNKQENEYSELQENTLTATKDNLSKCLQIIESSKEALNNNFPTKIRLMTPEEKEYIDKHKNEIPFEENQIKCKHTDPTELYESKKLTENEMTDLKDQLSDEREPNKTELEKQTTGILDGILVVVDPEINTEDYEEVIDRANEIIEGTEEGKIPYIEDYINNYIQTCPICGQTFVTAKLLQGGDTCPLCTKQPEAFVTVGQIRPDEDQEKALENDKELDTDIDIQQDNTEDIMDTTEDIDNEEEETIEEL